MPTQVQVKHIRYMSKLLQAEIDYEGIKSIQVYSFQKVDFVEESNILAGNRRSA